MVWLKTNYFYRVYKCKEWTLEPISVESAFVKWLLGQNIAEVKNSVLSYSLNIRLG